MSFIHELEPRWIILAACMLLPVGLAGGTLWIQWRNWRTRWWNETQGTIDSSKVVARDVQSTQSRTSGTGRDTEYVTDQSTRTRNFAAVSYSFLVGADTYRSKRVGVMGEPDGPVASVLKRYPKGRIVTVYYNPKNPTESILERDPPARIREAWLGTAVLAGLILGCFFAFTEGATWLETIVPHPERVTAMMMLIAIALVILMIVRGITKQTSIMKKWPTTTGRIVRSEVTTSVRHHSRPNRPGGDYDMTMYAPRIVYAYEAGGHSYEGDDVGWSTTANRRSVAEKQVKRYPLKSEVKVFYNPNDPSEATLAPSVGKLAWLLWFIAAALAFLAYALGWLIP